MNANETNEGINNKILYKDESFRIVGAAMEVHNTLGSGFLEAVYQEAFQYELEALNIPFKREVSLPIVYKNKTLSKYYIADFICYECIIVEVKALTELTKEHKAQVINYLKATNYELGILVNFGSSKLSYERIIREHSRRTEGTYSMTKGII